MPGSPASGEKVEDVVLRTNRESRNSWSAPSFSISLETREPERQRVWRRERRAEKLIAICALITLITFVLNSALFKGLNLVLQVIYILNFCVLCFGAGTVFYKNVSWYVLMRLMRELNVIAIILALFLLIVIDFVLPVNSMSQMNICVFGVGWFLFLVLDSINIKSRSFMTYTGTIMTLATLFNIYNLSFTNWDSGVVLLGPYLNGHVLMKRSVKRTLYIQALAFSLNGWYTILKDKNQEMMIFVTGNIYRETGTDKDHVSIRRNVNLSARSIFLLGIQSEIDEHLPLREKRGEIIAGVWAAITILLYIANSAFSRGQNVPLNICMLVAFAFCFLGMVMIFYKNISWVLMKRLLTEINVVMILLCSFSVFVINVADPRVQLDAFNGFVYFAACSILVFLDAVKIKSRIFVVCVCSMFAVFTLYCICDRTFTNVEEGIVLLGPYLNNLVLMKRSVKRACFIQIFIFSLSGLSTMYKDRDQKLMMFATGNIYRETRTSSMLVRSRSSQEDLGSRLPSVEE
jgi:hypothetical protein